MNKNDTQTIYIMNKKLPLLYRLFALATIIALLNSFSSQPPIGRTGAPGDGRCTDCHNNSNPQGLDGDISITGLPNEISPQTTYPITVTVRNPNALSLRAGFQMVALDSDNENAGSLANPSAQAIIQSSGNGRSYLGHQPAQAYDVNNSVIWTVDWTSPDAGSMDEQITFYSVGNITDMNNGSNTANDFIVFNTLNTLLKTNVEPLFSDLSISDLSTLQNTAVQGDVVSFDFDLNNMGDTIAANNYRIGMYLSTDTLLSSSDSLVGEVPTGNTPIGTIADVPGAITVPTNLTPGDYYLLIAADIDDTVMESDETNNLLVSPNTIMIEASVILGFNIVDIELVSCFGGNDGSITITGSGGQPPYTYQWSTGATTSKIENLVDGNYLFTITDSRLDSVEGFAFTREPDSLIANIDSITNIECLGDTTGAATLTISGGTAPYTVNWPVGSDGNNLPAGNYIPTITDDNGCIATTMVDIIQQDTIAPIVDCQDTIRVSACQDNVDYIPPPGFDNCLPLTIELTEGLAPGSVFPAGTTRVTFRATDPSGNMDSCSFFVVKDQPIAVVIDNTENTSGGLDNGAIDITVSGGAMPYTYSWTLNNQEISTAEDLSDLGAGDYILEVRDANDCPFILETITIEGSVSQYEISFINELELFPNPATELVQLKLDLAKTSLVTIQLYTLQGSLVLEQNMGVIKRSVNNIDVSTLATGVYFTKIIIGNETIIRRIIKGN